MVSVRSTWPTHLGHDCRALGDALVPLSQAIAEMLHSTDAVEDVVAGVDSPTHALVVPHATSGNLRAH